MSLDYQYDDLKKINESTLLLTFSIRSILTFDVKFKFFELNFFNWKVLHYIIGWCFANKDTFSEIVFSCFKVSNHMEQLCQWLGNLLSNSTPTCKPNSTSVDWSRSWLCFPAEEEEGRRKSNPHLAFNRGNGPICLDFGDCLLGVWRVFGNCLEGVWQVSVGCLIGVLRVSGRCLEGVLRMSGGYLWDVRIVIW